MTGSRLRLESFDVNPGRVERQLMTAGEREDLRLAAFEKGYSAGWDDAVAAQIGEAGRLRTDLARNLQDLSFTYHEARNHVLRAMEPLLRDMVAKVLPAVARSSIAPLALEALKPLAEEMAGAPITVLASPAMRDLVEGFLSGNQALPLRVVAEPTLGEGQVYLRMGQAETRVDLDGVIAAIASAIAAYFDHHNSVHAGTESEIRNG